MEAILKDLERGNDSDNIICDITRNVDELLLMFPDGTKFALLCKQTTKALQNIVSGSQSTLPPVVEIYLEASERVSKNCVGFAF
jgi:hypothetical protein